MNEQLNFRGERIEIIWGADGNAFQTLSAANAAALGLDEANPVIPDATGRERYPKPSPGPLDFAHAATRFYVR